MTKLSVKKNSIWNIGNYGFSIVSLFFLFPFVIGYIGDNSYGFFIFLGTINGVANIANFGFGEATIRFIALYFNSKQEERLKKVISTSFWTFLVLGLIASAAIIVFAEPIVGLLKNTDIENAFAVILVQLSAITFLIRFVFGMFSSIPMALQRYDISSKVAISETIIRIALYVLFLFFGYGIIGLVYAELLLAIIISITNYIISSKILNTWSYFANASKETFKEIFNYSVFSFLSQIVGLLWQYTDRILLGFFIGASAIAYFSVPQQIIFKILGLVAAAAAVLFPRFSMDKMDDKTKKLYKDFSLVCMLFSIVVFSTISVVIKDIIALWISPAFAEETKYIAIILSVSCMIRGAFPVYENLFKGIGKPIYNMYIIIASSFIIVVTDLILIPIMGINGAGIAYLISPIVGVVVIILIWKNIIKRAIVEPIKMYFIPLLISYFLVFGFIIFKNQFIESVSWSSAIIQSIIFMCIQLFIIGLYLKIFVKDAWSTLVKIFKEFRLLNRTAKSTQIL